MLWSSLALTGLIAAVGVLLRWVILDSGAARPIGTNIYYRLYTLYELPHLLLLAAFVGITAALAARGGHEAARRAPLDLAPPRARWVSLVALGVLVIGVIVGRWVMHGLLFSMDEFSADFQARIFARGEYAPVVPWPWRSLKDSITPIFVELHEDSGRWVSQYLPVYSLLKAAFVGTGSEALLNPLLGAGSIVAIGAVARRMWPDEGLRPWMAVALLATSTQVLVTSGSGYSMPAHLFLNLLWLWLYLRRDAKSWAAALAVGVLALGLHQPVPHALFVAPFMLRLLRRREWGRLASAAAVYVAGAAVWFAWMRFANPLTSASDSGLFTIFELPGTASLALLAMNFSLLLTWHAPLLGILLFVALSRLRELEDTQADLALGVLFTLGLFAFYTKTQGHGWGYRYAYQVLGSVCLLAASGAPRLVEMLGARAARYWIAAGLAVSLLVQLPLRLRDTERFVRPFAAASGYVRGRDATVVLLWSDAIWYGRDLLRNDPFLRYPIVVRAERLAPSLISDLRRLFPGRVVEVTEHELLDLGMTAASRRQPFGEPERPPVGSPTERQR